ncbi:hypothetical protein, partial [Oenococcus oeni]|uniref:hypothetical protein n=1 Tax=Oenococcus oeni TaxID=1247 RepID=UPI00214B1675
MKRIGDKVNKRLKKAKTSELIPFFGLENFLSFFNCRSSFRERLSTGGVACFGFFQPFIYFIANSFHF